MVGGEGDTELLGQEPHVLPVFAVPFVAEVAHLKLDREAAHSFANNRRSARRVHIVFPTLAGGVAQELIPGFLG
jgi:hypothetical protein